MSQTSILIFDQTRLQHNKDRAAKMPDDHRFLFTHVEQNLQDRLQDIKRNFTNPIKLSNHITHIDGHDVFQNDTEKNDLILSNLDLHWVNDLPGFLIQINRSLKADGAFLGAMFGGETLHELRSSLMAVEMEMFGGVSPRVSPFAGMKDIGSLMQRAGFALPVVDHEITEVTYENVFKLIQDIRGMGQGNATLNRSNKYLGREFWARVADYYQTHFSIDDDRIVASFEVIYFIGWSPDESQQQPLRPGSAQTSLAQILKTDEIKLPDKANPKV